MPSDVLASRYAEALAGAIEDDSILDDVSAELQAIAGLVAENAQLKAFLEGPNIRDEDKRALIRRTFGDRVHGICLDFLYLLIDKHRLDHLGAASTEFKRLVEGRRNQIRVQVTTAFTIPVDMADRLKRALDAATGHDCILEPRVDGRIIAGVIVKLDDRIIDGSVRTALDDMRERLMHVAL